MRSGKTIAQPSRLTSIPLMATDESLTDADLLTSFIERRDETSFEAIVLRHSPAIRAACRTWLTSAHDIDDATQATFLILVKRAQSIRQRSSLGAWLYRVAEQVARRLKTRLREQPLEHDPARESQPQDDTSSVIFQEIARLPEKQRRVVQLCYVAGLTTEEAALRLEIPKGTVLTRLAAGRKRLQACLLRRGLAPAILSSTVLSSTNAVSPWWLWGVLRTAKGLLAGESATLLGIPERTIAITEGVLNAMFLNKLKYVAAFAFVAAALVGFGIGQWASASGESGPRKSDEPMTPGASKPTANLKDGNVVKTLLGSPIKDRTEIVDKVDTTKAEAAKVEPAKQDGRPGRRREAVIKVPQGSFGKEIDVPFPGLNGTVRVGWTYEDERVSGSILVNCLGGELELAIEGEYSMSSHGVIYGVITSAKVLHFKMPQLNNNNNDELARIMLYWPLVEPMISEILTDMPFSYQCRILSDKLVISNFRMLLSGPNPFGKFGALNLSEKDVGLMLTILQIPSMLFEGTYSSIATDGKDKPSLPKRTLPATFRSR